MYAQLTGHMVEPLLDSVGARAHKRLLDLGTGPGYVAEAARVRGCDVVGLDFSASMVELARSLYPLCRFDVGDAQDLPFGAATFDSVTGNFLLHHVPEQELALREARRVLVSGGAVGLTAWASPDRNRFLGLFVDAVQAADAAIPPDLPSGPPMAVSESGYRAQLRRAGFEECWVEHMTWNQRFASATALWDGLMEASVRTAALIELQPPRTRDVIHREFDRLAKSYETDGSLEVPLAATLIGGRVPTAT